MARSGPLRAAVIGAASWNHIVHVPRVPLEDLRTVFALEQYHCLGGTGAGKALNLARLGFASRLHALVGQDDEGTRVARALAEGGVHLTRRLDPAGTEQHLNLVDGSGRRSSVYLNPSSADAGLAAADLVDFARGADVVFVSLAEYARPALAPLRAAGIPLWLDAHDWDGREEFHLDFIEHADFLFLSDVRLDDPIGLAQDLAHTRSLVVVTHGEAGATVFVQGSRPIHVEPAPVVDQVDTNGAGDAFSAGVAYGFAKGWDWEKALRAGAWVAARCVETRAMAGERVSPTALEDHLRQTTPPEAADCR